VNSAVDVPLSVSAAPSLAPTTARPRIGFLGLGWIGQHRMRALHDSGEAEVVAIADPSTAALDAARAVVPRAEPVSGLPALLDAGLDALVIATPSAQHADQAIAALERGVAVFCQKPLGRDAAEAQRVVDAARAADRALGVDLSYRHTRAVRAVHELVRAGSLGEIFAADLVFHNAYGPDKAWFYDRAQAGGGCVMDLGVHLIDLAFFILGRPKLVDVHSQLFAGGCKLEPRPSQVEDYALATLVFDNGAVARLACSWKAHAGRDCVIEASFHGTRGGASFRNVNGSFYDFTADAMTGTSTRRLVQPPDAWGGAALIEWTRRLRTSGAFDPGALSLVELARAIDRIYGRA
jgi:predicted dehydrogenase